MLCIVTQTCPTLCDIMDCSPWGSSVHGILQARILEWVAMPSSKRSSWPRDQTHSSHSAGGSLPLSHQGSPSIVIGLSSNAISPFRPSWRHDQQLHTFIATRFFCSLKQTHSPSPEIIIHVYHIIWRFLFPTRIQYKHFVYLLPVVLAETETWPSMLVEQTNELMNKWMSELFLWGTQTFSIFLDCLPPNSDLLL